jgi:hypothetical protein
MDNRRLALAQARKAHLCVLADTQIINVVWIDAGDNHLTGIARDDFHQGLARLDHAALGKGGQADYLTVDRRTDLIAGNLGTKFRQTRL